jgi:hypothetical protein
MEETGSTASRELTMKESHKIFALIHSGKLEKQPAADGNCPSVVDFVAIEPQLHPDIRRGKPRRERGREESRDVGPICLIRCWRHLRS